MQLPNYATAIYNTSIDNFGKSLFLTLPPSSIIKRNGSVVQFKKHKILEALNKCYCSLDIQPSISTEEITERIVRLVSAKYYGTTPTVENVQDAVESVLLSLGEIDAARHYILYRAEHEKMRDERPIPAEVKQAYLESSKYFPTPLQYFQFVDKYARYNYSLGRRETWIETVDRAVDFLYELGGDSITSEDYQLIRRAILDMKVMPSMRLLAMAGEAARRQSLSIYNCSFIEVDSIDAFSEALLISMSGCGIGFSVENRCIEKFPRISRQRSSNSELIVVEDTTEGWVDSVKRGLDLWFNGYDAQFDFSQLRPAGAVLKIKGGRSSGPEPLRAALSFARSRILARQGSFLRPLDAHDIMCSIGNAAVSGGVRRTAMISLFDFDDQEMLHCKDGDFETHNSQRWNANNSAVWTSGGITQEQFIRQFLSMVEGGAGEPGIFNRDAAYKMSPSRRVWLGEPGTNPCGEVNLHNMELCNLSIAVARYDDTIEDIREKVRLATIIGTIQSTATHFPGLRSQWKENCERERLLGVDITGQMDSKVIQKGAVKEYLRQLVINTNFEYADKLGINRSAATTVCKPSGNSSQLLDCSSGIHARWSPYYIRNVRVSAHSPLFKVMKDAGVPMDPENGQNPEDANAWVIHFPVKSPDGSITRNDRTAIEQCEYWLENKLYWTEHNPSVTITYKPEEVIDLMKWVWDHKDVIGGMAFLPSFDAIYAQLPYIEISKEEYEKRVAEFPEIDFSKIYAYEETDMTTASQEVACLGGVCELQL